MPGLTLGLPILSSAFISWRVYTVACDTVERPAQINYNRFEIMFAYLATLFFI